MDRRRLRNNVVRALAALAVAAGLSVGGVALTPAHADDVVWIKAAQHQVQVSPKAPASPAPHIAADDVVWI